MTTWKEVAEDLIRCESTGKCTNAHALQRRGVLRLVMDEHTAEFEGFKQCHATAHSDIAIQRCEDAFKITLDKAEEQFINYVRAHSKGSFANRETINRSHPSSEASHVIFKSPFWATPLGSIWKRVNQGEVLHSSVCQELELAADRCPFNATMSNQECTILQKQATLCRAGVACPDTQPSLLQCYLQVLNRPLDTLTSGGGPGPTTSRAGPSSGSEQNLDHTLLSKTARDTAVRERIGGKVGAGSQVSDHVFRTCLNNIATFKICSTLDDPKTGRSGTS